MAGNVVSNVKKYYGGQVPVPGQGDSDGKVKVLVEKTATMEIEGVQTEVELLFDSDDLTTPVTPQQLGQWTDENYLIAFKKRDDDGRVRGFVLYALSTESTSTDTLVNRAEFISFKEDMNDPGASAYEFTMVEDSSTLTRYLRDENGELIVKFNQASVEADAQSGTLDNLIGSDSDYVRFEVVHDEDDNAYLNLSTESLDDEIDAIWKDVTYIIDALDELPSDEHGYFNSSLIQTPGDGTTENIIIDDFRISQGGDVHGESIEFVPTHQEGGVDFGEVYLNPGTYIFTVQYTLQWVGYPRGTFLPLVTNVGDRPFDFSYEHEDTVRTTRIVTRTTRGKFSLSFPFDADTPQMGIWVKNLEIAQIASYNHPAVAHDTTLAGTGKLDSPLGVTPAAFGKVKDIPTSISQFRTGDVIPVDGPNGPAKMEADTLLELTTLNTVFEIFPGLYNFIPVVVESYSDIQYNTDGTTTSGPFISVDILYVKGLDYVYVKGNGRNATNAFTLCFLSDLPFGSATIIDDEGNIVGTGSTIYYDKKIAVPANAKYVALSHNSAVSSNPINLYYFGTDVKGNSINYDESTFTGCVNSTLLALQNKYPNSRIVVCTPLNNGNYYNHRVPYFYENNGIGLKLKDYVDRIKECAALFSCPVIDLNGELGLNPFVTSQKNTYYSSPSNDNLHPNTAGHKLLANVIIDALKNKITPFGDYSDWAGKSSIWIGDSITANTGGHTTKIYFEIVKDELSLASAYNAGVSGTGYSRATPMTPCILDRLSEYSSDYDLVVVFTGINDFFGVGNTTPGTFGELFVDG